MAEKIYEIPVNDAFDAGTECPICLMYASLEQGAVDFSMGPSYMDDRFRLITDETGFCERHIRMIYAKENRLGQALVMHTHVKHTNDLIEGMMKKPLAGLFKNKDAELIAYIKKLEQSCFICDRIREMFKSYIHSVFYLYRQDENFRNKYKASKGFCTKHFGLLLSLAPESLSGKLLSEFTDQTKTIYLENMRRMEKDLEWFTRKFDYQYRDQPWNGAEDAIVRGMVKTNSILPEEDKKKMKPQ